VNVGLYRGAVAMAAGARQMDALASNLSNLSTRGYKRRTTAAHLVDVRRPNGTVQALATTGRVDFSQGDLERTGRDLDLALHGQGFFAIEGPAGEVYARDGSFHLSPDGELLTEEGFAVAWAERRATIDPAGHPILVDGEGGVTQGQRPIGRLRVVGFADPGRLGQDGHGYWSAPRGMRESAHSAVVHQGALEQSNASGVEEMVAMIAVQRSFETAASVVSSIEESYRRLTRPV
jgi:flagellar basal body rod protein FlgG